MIFGGRVAPELLLVMILTARTARSMHPWMLFLAPTIRLELVLVTSGIVGSIGIQNFILRLLLGLVKGSSEISRSSRERPRDRSSKSSPFPHLLHAKMRNAPKPVTRRTAAIITPA
jgi:hypothetical protein